MSPDFGVGIHSVMTTLFSRLTRKTHFSSLVSLGCENERLTFLVKKKKLLQIVFGPHAKTHEEPKFPLCKFPHLNSEMHYKR